MENFTGNHKNSRKILKPQVIGKQSIYLRKRSSILKYTSQRSKQMATTSAKSRMLHLLALAREEEQRFLETLSEEEKAEKGTLEQNSAKEMLAHITAWKSMHAQKLATIARGETPPVWTDSEVVKKIDAQIFEQNRDRSWQLVLVDALQAYNDLVAQVERMSEEELSDPQHYDWQNGEPLWKEIQGNGMGHPIFRMTAYYRQRGKLESAHSLQERKVTAMRQYETPDETLAAALYDMACYYALDGLSELAMERLTEALRLRPTLVGWSSNDSDLATLHTTPAYQALYAEFKEIGSPPAETLIDRASVQALQHDGTPPLILDVRNPSEYQQGAIAEALNLPVSQLQQRLQELPSDQLIVTYCNMHSRGESRCERAAALLREKGYQAKALDGGLPGWKEAGLPVK
jgi:rhodanese-related sulfurtransferase